MLANHALSNGLAMLRRTLSELAAQNPEPEPSEEEK